METVNKKIELNTGIINVVLIVIFAILFLMGDYGIAGDSNSYITMGLTREPGYPLLLCIMRALFGEEAYFVPLAFVQNAFACISVMWVAHYFGRRIFNSGLGYWVSALILSLPYLFTPVFSRTHLVMANKIMAEGITLPLYYLFMLYIVKVIFEEDRFLKNAALAWVVSLALVLARGQLILSAIIWFITMVIRLLREKKYTKIYITVLAVILLLACNTIITRMYHGINSGVFTATASSKPMILANALYVSQPEDGEGIQDPELKELFERVYKELDGQGMLYRYAEGGCMDKALHQEACHDTISFDYFEPIKNDIYYHSDHHEILMADGYPAYLIKQDEIASALTGELLKNNWPRYLTNYMNMCVLGFVRSIAVDHPLLNVYALVVYILGAALLIYTWRRNGFTNEVFFLGMTYVSIAGFVTATSLFLQCITRYMIYNLPFFYIAGFLLLVKTVTDGKKQKIKEEKENGISGIEI